MFELRRYIFSRTNNVICFLIVFYGWLQSSIELDNAREKAQKFEEIGEIKVLMPFHRHLKELEMLGEPYMSVMRYEFKRLEKELGFAVSPTFIIDQDITISHKLSKETKLLYVEMGMHSTDHVLVEKGLRTFENPVLDNLIAVRKDKNAAKNIFISLSDPLAKINEEQFKKIKANIKPGIFGVLGSPKAGLVFHGKDVLKLLEQEKTVKSSSMFLDFPKRIAKLAHVRHQWQASLRPFILPPVLLTLAQERFEKFYGRELEPNTKSMNISLTFQSDEIPPIYKFDMKQEFNGFLKYPLEFVEKYKCDQIGNKALYMLKTARNAVEERFRIRRYFRQNGQPLKNYIFFLGTSSSGFAWEDGDLLEDEFNRFNDIVIADFPDTYNNLPLKTKSLYEFALRFCDENINQYYFHDSDTLIHGEIENLVRNSMKEEQMSDMYNKACHDLEDDDQRCYHEPMTENEPMLMCLRHTGRNHGAIYWGKYNVTYEMFPPKYKYPDYCNGQCAVMNRKSLEAIGEEVGKTYLGDFRIEDIFFTGILREKAGVKNLQDFTRTVSELTSSSGITKRVKTKTCMHYSKEMIMTPKAHLIDDRFYPEMPTGVTTKRMFEERKNYFKRMHKEKLRETKALEQEKKEEKKKEEAKAQLLKDRNLEVAGIAPQNKGFHPINWLNHHFVRKN